MHIGYYETIAFRATSVSCATIFPSSPHCLVVATDQTREEHEKSVRSGSGPNAA